MMPPHLNEFTLRRLYSSGPRLAQAQANIPCRCAGRLGPYSRGALVMARAPESLFEHVIRSDMSQSLARVLGMSEDHASRRAVCARACTMSIGSSRLLQSA